MLRLANLLLAAFHPQTALTNQRFPGRTHTLCIHADEYGVLCRRNVSVDVTGWEELEDFKLKVSWRFQCILDLPWKPVLAAAGAQLARGCACIAWYECVSQV
jgi:hypothetical protein